MISLPPLSPSWAAASIRDEDGLTPYEALARSVQEHPPRIFLAEVDAAATRVQRVQRGKQCRRRLWAIELPGGALAHNWARKGQKKWRGVLGRRKAVRRAEAYVYDAATCMAAVCRGGSARRLARAMRAEVIEWAARRVIRAYRDKMVRKMLAEARRLRRARMRGRLQRYWRRALGRRGAWRYAAAQAVACARLDALAACARASKAAKSRHRLKLPPEDAKPGSWSLVKDAVGRVVAFAAESLLPAPWEVAALVGADPEPLRKPASKRDLEKEQERYAQLSALDKYNEDKKREEDAKVKAGAKKKKEAEGAAARAAARDPLLHAAHALALVGDCDAALAVLSVADATSPVVTATRAATLQLGWAAATKFKVALPDWLDEVLVLVAQARAADEARNAGAYYERAYLQNACAMWTQGMRAPNARAFAGAVVASFRGDPHLEPAASNGSARVRRARDTGRAAALLEAARILAEAEGGGDARAFAGAVACADAHDVLFARGRDDIVAKTRDLRCVASVGMAAKAADVDDAALEAAQAVRPVKLAPPGTKAGAWQVRVFAAGDCLICAAARIKKPVIVARDHVLLAADVENLAKRHFPRSEVDMAVRDGRLAEVVWAKLVLVGGDDGAHPPTLQVPEVARERAAAVRLAMEVYCALLVQRAYKGFDAASLFRRTMARVKERDRQRAGVAVQRAQRLLARLKRDAGLSKFQAVERGRAFRKLRKSEMKAAALLQAAARGVRKRRQDREALRRAREGAAVETVFQGGRRVGGCDLVLTVTRCGMNYKFAGQDFAANATYVGVVQKMGVEAAIQAANAERVKGDLILRLGKPEDVLAVLLDRLALVDAIAAPTKELRGGGRVLVVDASNRAKGGGPSLSKRAGLGRPLVDGALLLRDYHRKVKRDTETRAARGLGPRQPSVIAVQKAKAAFKARLGSNPISAKVLAARKKEARKRLEAQKDAE